MSRPGLPKDGVDKLGTDGREEIDSKGGLLSRLRGTFSGLFRPFFKQNEKDVAVEPTSSSSKPSQSQLNQQLLDDYLSKDQFNLTKALIEENVFKIEKTIEIDGSKFHVGPMMFDGGTLFCIAMVDRGDGELWPRLMYRSKSQSSWRSTRFTYIGKNGGLAFDKGCHAEAYTQETRIVAPLSDYLENRSEAGYFDRPSEKLLSEHFFKDNLDRQEIDTYEDEVEVVDVDGALDPFIRWGSMPGDLTASDSSEYFESLDDKYPEGFIPDFSTPPLSRKSKRHSVLGPAVAEIYHSSFNGQVFEWEMGYDSYGRVWIEGITPFPQKVNSYGANQKLLFTGLLTHKPVEYARFTSGLTDNTEKRSVRGFDQYVDITPLLDNLKPIRNFRQKNRIERQDTPCSYSDGYFYDSLEQVQ